MNLNIIDLSNVISLLASLGIVAALLQWLRDIGLDGLTAHMPDAQRNAILRALLILLNFGGVLGLSILMGQRLGGPLLISAGFAAFVAAGGSHVLYTYVQKPASQRYGVPDAPAPKVEPDPTDVPPAPPTDEPASAALSLAA